MADVHGHIGGEEVQLNNAATEATLKALLLATTGSVKKMQEIMDLATKAGIDAHGIENVNHAFVDSYTRLEKFNAMVSLVSSAFSFFRPAIDGVIQSMKAIASGSNNMSDVLSAFGGLPGPLGMVANGLAFLQKMQEENFASYQKLTESGVNFGGAINDLRIAASNMGLTFDQLSGLVVKNSDAFAMMGGGSDKAFKAFANASNQFVNSEAGTHLQALGYTTEQLNQGMVSYIRMTGGRTSKEMENTDALIASTTSYLETLDGLARISGKTREQQQAELDQASKNAAFQAKLATLGPEAQKKATEGMARALALGGKGAVDAFQSKIMGVAPDKAGAMYIAVAGKQAKVVDQIANTVMDKSKTVDDQKVLMVKGIRAAQADIAKYGNSTSFAISRQGGAVGDALNALGISANQAATMTDKEILAAMAESEDKDKMAKSQAAAEVANQKAMRQAREEIITALNQFRKDYMPKIQEFIISLGNLATYVKDNAKTFEKVAIGAIALWGAFKLLEGYLFAKQAMNIIRGGTGIAGSVATTVAGTAASGAGGVGLGASIQSVGTALAAVGRMGLWVGLGVTAIAAVIIQVGAAIAGATWLLGKTLPTLAEGFMSFTYINGKALVETGKGIGALGLALAAFGVGSPLAAAGTVFSNIMGSFSKFFGAKDTIDVINSSVSRLKGSIADLTVLGPALQAFGQGYMAFGAAITLIDVAKAERVTDLMKKPQVSAEVSRLARESLGNTSAGASSTDQKALAQVISQLNTNMAALTRYMAATSDNTSKTVSAVKALNPNYLNH
jgi:hypothetical protein